MRFKSYLGEVQSNFILVEDTEKYPWNESTQLLSISNYLLLPFVEGRCPVYFLGCFRIDLESCPTNIPIL